MLYFRDLENIAEGKILSNICTKEIKHLLVDSRKSYLSPDSLFLAIRGARHDGHDYISLLYSKGVCMFIVEQDIDTNMYPKASFLLVENSIHALQAIGRWHREQFNPEVVGITGSNGKTIVKEWLFQLLSPYKNVVKNPHSYNSQIGVPLSVWQIDPHHELGIFEAGISQPGEMRNLEPIIKPKFGIFTNIGPAHDQGFRDLSQKIIEKSFLFKHAERIIYCKDHKPIDSQLNSKGFTWGEDKKSDIVITSISKDENETTIDLQHRSFHYNFKLPFTDRASIENCMHCITFMIFCNYKHDQIQKGIDKLDKISMRLELKKGINNCYIIDDSYNNDVAGLQIALDFLANQKQHAEKTLILSDILQSGLSDEELCRSLSGLVEAHEIHKFIGIGPMLSDHKGLFSKGATFYSSTQLFLEQQDMSKFQNEVILIKGARSFLFETIVKSLEEKIHGTILEINLNALTNNLNFYRSKIKPETKLMVMVKAFAYGSGSMEIANLLQFHRVDYLGVAYTDEGVYLRENGIHIPIMVMNPTEDSIDKLIKYSLEPEIYSLSLLDRLIDHVRDQPISIHIKLDTGMRRLGFDPNDFETLIDKLRSHNSIEVKSIFSHLAGSDEEVHNGFSLRQAALFEEMSKKLIMALGIKPIRHLVNSPGIIRFPEYHYDMVRLGIGLYGVEASNQQQSHLEPISSLKTIISQIKKVNKGETIGYGRKGKATDDMVIAIIAIGYADGFVRAFSNGVGEVWVSGRLAKVVGNVCMDMTMIDVTGLAVKEGAEVEIFGSNISIIEMAKKINTIPYEILTNVSQRVKRIYFAE